MLGGEMKQKIMSLIFLGFISIAGNVARADTFTVNTTDDTVDVNPGDGIAADASGNCSLRAAIMEANALAGMDTIVLPGGLFTLTIEGIQEDSCLTGDLDILTGMVIQGAGKNLSIIDGNQIDRVFHIKGNIDVSLFDLTIRNGKTPDGGAPPALTVGGSGGGILNRFATLNIENCKIIKNETGNGQEISIYTDIGPSGGFGGGIYNKQGIVSIKNSNISHNRTGRGGWGSLGGKGGCGGGIFNCSNSSLALQNCDIRRNRTGDYGYGGDGFGNGGDGGGIGNSGELIVVDSTIRENSCGDGGYYELGGSGGGVFNSSSGFAEISQTLIEGNVTGLTDMERGKWGWGYGGGICNNFGQVILRNCTICNNRIKEYSWGVGGGIYNTGEISLSNCTVYKNRSNCNRFFDNLRGGGICNCFWEPFAAVKVKNTIIAENSAGLPWSEVPNPNDCHGTITSQGHNLITTTAGCTIVGNETGNIYGIDPLLGALADNGGPTMTHRLRPASPAIDAGHPSDFEATDQRGVLRSKDGDGDGNARSDIGAFELFSPSVTITSPGTGEIICGTISIEATANTDCVDFFIDNILLCESVASPFLCSWDSTLYVNGSHKIKAEAYDAEVPWLAAQNQFNVLVDNTLIDLNVSSITDKAWIIRRECGRVTFTVTHAGSIPVSKYIVERKEEGGSYSTITEIDESELTGNSYVYNDPLPNKNVSYTYRVRAVSSMDMNVGMSTERTI
jgi:CSLREA domain-containing protein